ncbi:MAG: hypothetical protein ACWGQW_02305 [bacterium]
MNVDNSEDIVDTRDVIDRISDIEVMLEDDLDEWEREDYEDELRELTELAAELPNEAHYGEPLIRDSYFIEYAQQLADDLGYTSGVDWPFDCIDWDLAADELKIDYICVNWGGVDFWVRG